MEGLISVFVAIALLTFMVSMPMVLVRWDDKKNRD